MLRTASVLRLSRSTFPSIILFHFTVLFSHCGLSLGSQTCQASILRLSYIPTLALYCFKLIDLLIMF